MERDETWWPKVHSDKSRRVESTWEVGVGLTSSLLLFPYPIPPGVPFFHLHLFTLFIMSNYSYHPSTLHLYTPYTITIVTTVMSYPQLTIEGAVMSTQPPSTRRKVCGEEGGDPMHATAAELRPTMVTYDSIEYRRVESTWEVGCWVTSSLLLMVIYVVCFASSSFHYSYSSVSLLTTSYLLPNMLVSVVSYSWPHPFTITYGEYTMWHQSS